MKTSILWNLTKSLCRIISTVCFDLKVYGTRNIPRRGGVLLVANHESYLDPVLVGVQISRPLFFLAKSELFENPVFGWFIRSLNAFPVRQGEGDIGAVRETIRRLKEGHMLNIFPEGSRSETGELGPIEPGIGLIIRRAGVPVVPVAVIGSFEAWPRDRMLFRSHPIRVLYGPPLRLDGMKSDQIVQIIDETFRAMLDNLRHNITH